MFPDECRICHEKLTGWTKLPICPKCIAAPEPFAAEHFCITCKTPFLNEYPLSTDGQCALCAAGMRGFDAVYCYGEYDGTLRELIHLFKYGRMKALRQPLGKMLLSALPLDGQFDAVVPVPLHWRKRWTRGFNQSELLASYVGKRRGYRVANAMGRLRAGSAQAGLSNNKRRENVSGVFRASRSVAGLRVLLIDDVMTTGSTAGACALALKRAGAKHVTLLTLARVDRRLAALTARNNSQELT